MLELKNINITLALTGKRIIDNFSFTLNEGDRAVIIGEEGNGKSTLLKLIYDPAMIEGYCEYTGTVIKHGTVAYLPQMMDEKYYDVSVSDYLALEYEGQHAAVFESLGLPPDFPLSRQKIGTLSGGEKVKLQLARLLADEPDMLLLDEPTNDIDIETLLWMEDFISSSRVPILYVSHDETLIENTANVIIHIEELIKKTQCRVSVTRMGYGEYIRARGQLYDKQLQVAEKQRSDYKAKIRRWREIYEKVDTAQRNISRGNPSGGRLLKKKMKSVKAQKKRYERESDDFMPMPQTEEAIITRFSESIIIPAGKTTLDFELPELYAKDKFLARDIKLRVTGAAHIGITGKNGVGKSTLLAEIWRDIASRRDIIPAYMPQNYAERLDYNMTPLEFLDSHYKKDDITRARTYMGSMKFTRAEMTGKIGALSGGQRAKLLFLDMVLREANVLLLDEPTRNFSPLSSPVVRAALEDFGGAIISVSHDRRYLDEVCDTVYELTPAGLRIIN